MHNILCAYAFSLKDQKIIQGKQADRRIEHEINDQPCCGIRRNHGELSITKYNLCTRVYYTLK
jgi:hypothetical protein